MSIVAHALYFSTTFRGLAATATTGAALQTIDNLGQRQIEDSKDKEEKPSTNEGHDMVRRGTEEAIEVDEQGVAGEPGSIALVDDNNGEELYDLAHKFAEHTYRSPTNCDICHGLLVGLWSQGLQCEKCGVNCHRGEGIGDHDDCLAEAMLAPCGCVQPKSSKADDSPREKTKVRTAGGKSNSEMVYARQLMF